MTTGYIKELEYIEKPQTNQQENIREVSKISQDKLPPMSEQSGFTFHHNLYLKEKVALEDAVISDKTWDRLQDLKQDYNDIVMASHFVMDSVLSITTRGTPLSAVTMMWSLSFLRFSGAKCSALVMFVCNGLLV